METLDMLIRAEFIPTVTDARDNDYYSGELNTLPAVETAFEPSFKLDFPMQYSPKIRYCCRIIDNEIINRLNSEFSDKDMSDSEIAFHRMHLERWVGGKLDEIGRSITDYNLDMSEITGKTNYSENPQRKDCTFLLNYLAVSLVRCYMEFQSKFYDSIEEQYRYQPEYLYTCYMKQSPAGNFIIPIASTEEDIEVLVSKPPKDPKKYALYYTKKGNSRKDNLEYALESLKNSKMVDSKTKKPTFVNAFSGTVPTTPVKWIGGPESLHYFIKSMEELGLIKFICKRNYKWPAVVNCFVAGNGEPFETAQLRKEQKDVVVCVDAINKAIELLK